MRRRRLRDSCADRRSDELLRGRHNPGPVPRWTRIAQPMMVLVMRFVSNGSMSMPLRGVNGKPCEMSELLGIVE